MGDLASLTWRAGAGWLVLAGGTSDRWRTTEPVDRAAIGAIARDGPIAFVPAAGCPPDYGETFLETYARLRAPSGYVVEVRDRASARGRRNAALLRRASLIYFGGGDSTLLLETMTGSPALEAVAEAYEAGAVVVGHSAGAIGLAAWGVPLSEHVDVLQGWGWLAEAVVSVHHGPAREARLRSALAARPGMLGIGLPEDSALALGPAGQRETWGAAGLTVAFG